MENTIEQEVFELYPKRFDGLYNKHNEDLRGAFRKGCDFANSQITHHLDKLTEGSKNDQLTKIKEYVKSLDTPENEIYKNNDLLIMSCFSKAMEIMEQSITNTLNEYKLKHKL